MPYYGHIYYGYGDFLANNLYVLLLIPVLLLSLWAQFQVSGSFRRYNAVNNRRRITGAQAAEAVLRAHGVFGVPVRPCRGAREGRISGGISKGDPKRRRYGKRVSGIKCFSWRRDAVHPYAGADRRDSLCGEGDFHSRERCGDYNGV